MPARAVLPALRNVFATLFIPDATPGTGPWFDDLLPVSTDGETVARILTTSWHRRSRVGSPGESTQPLSPTHSLDDERIPFEEGRLRGSLIPNARLIPLETRNLA